jgi:hypothetical protein
MLRAQGVPAEHIHLNGHPAYQLYDEPYRHYFAPRLELARRHGLDPARRWVFFPENYNWAFYTDWRLDDMQQAGGLKRADLEAMVQFTRRAFQREMGWCHAVASQAPVELIVRPRPLTPLADFQAALRAVLPEVPAHLHVLKDQSVREWILASDVVVSSYSTSLIEAGIAGKPAFMLEPEPLHALLQVEWQQYVPRLTGQAAFLQACREADARRHDNHIGTWARAHMLAHGDAIAGLADILAALRRQPAARWSYSSLTTTKRRRWVPDGVWFHYRRLRGRAARRGLPDQLSPFYERDHFAPAEITRRVEGWRRVLGARAPEAPEAMPRPVAA